MLAVDLTKAVFVLSSPRGANGDKPFFVTQTTGEVIKAIHADIVKVRTCYQLVSRDLP